MSAREMFEKLGYKLVRDCKYYLFYEKALKEDAEYENDYLHISFEKQDKAFIKTYGDESKLENKPTQNNLYYPKSILTFSNADKNNKLHPTQKPVELVEYLVKTYTQEGETVLDNCMGSGSTGVACVNTNRRFIGIELSEEYYNIAVRRINEAKQI